MGGMFFYQGGGPVTQRWFRMGRKRRKKPQPAPKRKRRSSRPDCLLRDGSGQTVIWWSSELPSDCLEVLQLRFGPDLRVRGLYPGNDSFIEDYLDFIREEPGLSSFVVLPLDLEASLTNQLRPTVAEMKKLGLSGLIALVKDDEMLELDRVAPESGWYQEWVSPKASMRVSKSEDEAETQGFEYHRQSAVPLSLAQALRRAS